MTTAPGNVAGEIVGLIMAYTVNGKGRYKSEIEARDRASDIFRKTGNVVAVEEIKSNRPEWLVHTFSRGLNGDREAFVTCRCRGTVNGESLYFAGQKRRIHDAGDFRWIEWKGDIFKVQPA